MGWDLLYGNYIKDAMESRNTQSIKQNEVEKLLSMVEWDDYMKRIKMKNDTTKFVWDGDNCVGKYTELIEQYHYDSEEEKMEHKIEMELNGWNDSGQVMEMISGSLMPGAKNPPVHVWFGSYHKTIKE